jgi:site-specific DNA-methyltransferase (adenine-specific)
MDMAQLKLFSGQQKEKGFDHPLLSEMSRDFYMEPVYATEKGILYEGDCLQILPNIKSETVDTVFADPPFNLKKNYGGRVNDNLTPKKYL